MNRHILRQILSPCGAYFFNTKCFLKVRFCKTEKRLSKLLSLFICCFHVFYEFCFCFLLTDIVVERIYGIKGSTTKTLLIAFSIKILFPPSA